MDFRLFLTTDKAGFADADETRLARSDVYPSARSAADGIPFTAALLGGPLPIEVEQQ